MSIRLPTGVRLRDYSANYCNIIVGGPHDRGYRVGAIVTPDGIVRLYDQGRKSGERPMTSLDVVVGGQVHTATWDRTFSDRFLKTLAKRFAAGAGR